ncbi:hypothetical protein SELMODRAFT_447362 [Selaginella moellendorffii]|uniref:WAT1-related protein n=1 Tax=Selaginella moellendorffii TaxID=88036 RepID=D8SYU4_SELML|nr:WAT1-related protein At4g19185 [Selaginella moellendorffii]EFJ10300.1 hypothetical protein SELMODRAFT_447362 [Selaginella moellendorffii]|eukprot:XP_002988504.1 WAT1-related protein At4g19185 [Selaginella moellendorffii]
MADIRASNLTVHAALLLTQFLTAFMTLATQAVLKEGVNRLVLGCYCLFLAGAVLAVAAFVFERGRDLRITFGLILQLLVFGFFVFIIQILGLVGLSKTSASFVSAMHPLSTVFTAAFAMLFGVEKVKLLSVYGQAKIAGILVCAGGAILMILYKGPCVLGLQCSSPSSTTPIKSVRTGVEFQVGAFCIVLSSMAAGAMGTFAAKLLEKRPTPVTILAITFLIGSLVSGTAGFFTIDSSAWRLTGSLVPVVMLISVLSLSIFPVLMLWSVMRLGPTIVGCYTPVNTLITSLFSSIFLGSIIGALFILIGLLLVSWAHEECSKSTAEQEAPCSAEPLIEKIEAINLA